MNWGYVAGYFDGEGCAGIYHVASKSPNYHKCELTWHNTHLESLVAIQEFIGCGRIDKRGDKNKAKETHKDMYALHVERRADMLLVIPHLLEYCLIKTDKLREIQDWLVHHTKDQSQGYGTLDSFGVERIRHLYWEGGLTQEEIAERVGVTQTAVSYFMQKHGLLRRSKPAAFAGVKGNSKKWAARSAKLSEMRRRNWEDPAYRENMVAKIRASQEKRIATLKRNRGEKD